MKTFAIRSIDLTLGAGLASLALAIPIVFRGTLQFTIPQVGYSATLASHVPSMVSILAGPVVSFLVGAASSLGFLITFGPLGPVIAARAFTHAIWGALGAYAYRRGWSFLKAMVIIALPIHAIGEPIATIIFGIPPVAALSITGVGTVVHHIADMLISMAVIRAAKPVLAPVILGGVKIR